MHQAAPNIEEIFFAALEIEGRDARSAFLDQACGDPELRHRVERLLARDAQASSFLESPAVPPTVTVGSPSLSEGPGTVIGPYKLREQIGEGGMGVVYVAEQTQPVRRKVALKVIKPGMDTKQVIARFEAERQALAMTDHPNIARVIDAGATESGRPYFVMELVRGIPITDYCDRERLSISERLELFVLACRAVQHAHQKGIIHRDLKPSNILVTVIDGAAVPKIIDFGVAKATGASLTERTLYTAFQQFVGTPLYMSPEQADLSGADMDTRSDIYSLGVLLYELLTGTTPFDQDTFRRAAFDELRRIIREQEPPRPSTRLSSLGATRATVSANRQADTRHLDRAVRGELDWIVMKALEKDRNRRYETANGLAADVRRYLNDEPVQACPPSAWYRLSKAARRHRAAFVTTALVLSALVVGLSLSIWQAIRATRAERAALRAEATTRTERDRAVKAEGQATEAARKAQTEAAISKAINDFLLNDLLAEAAPEKNARNQQVTVEAVLNKAAARVAGKFDGQPEVEAAIRQTVGETYLALGLYQEGLPHLQRALELRRRVLGPEHRETLDIMQSLGVLFQHLRKFGEAEALIKQALEGERRVLGPEHAFTLNTLHSLAVIYLEEDQDEKAEPLFEQALEAQRRVLGPEHDATLRTMGTLAELYRYQGRYEKAEPLFEQALEAQRRVLGPEHTLTLNTMHNLAGLYEEKGQYEKAESLAKQVLEAMRRVNGPDHPETWKAINDLAVLYVRQGRLEEAESSFTRLIESLRRRWGVEPGFGGFPGLNLPFILTRRGRILLRLGRYAEAEAEARESLRIYQERDYRDWPRADATSVLGASLRGQAKYAEAKPLLLSAYEGLKAAEADLGIQEARLTEAGERIVQLYEAWGRPEQAAEWKAKLGLTDLPDDVFARP
jgi:non-specific serine/threonine protein kinase/serine/threonine-protein kinase